MSGFESPGWLSRTLHPSMPPARSPAFEGCVLTASELEVVRMVAKNLTYKQIALALGKAESTLRAQMNTTYKRLGISSKFDAVTICRNAGWLDPLPSESIDLRPLDRRVTWAQRLYLEAFDQSLRAKTPEEVARTDLLRSATLQGVFKEAGKTLREDRRPWQAMASNPYQRLMNVLTVSLRSQGPQAQDPQSATA